MLTNHDIKENNNNNNKNNNIPFCNNPAELLAWKHALCEEFRNWSLSLENNMGITERQSFYLSESNDNIIFFLQRCVACEVRLNLNYRVFQKFVPIFYSLKFH